MNRKLNILIAIESFFDGGAEMFAIRLANELSLTHRVCFVELYPYLTTEKHQLSLLNQKRIKLFQPGKNWIGDRLFKNGLNEQTSVNGIRQKVTGLYRLLKKRAVKLFIKKYNITIINSHSWDSDVYFSGVKKESAFTLISSFHGHYAFLADKRKNYDEITRTTLSQIDSVIYTSPEQLKTLIHYQFASSKVHKIFYGLTLPLSTQTTRYQQGECLQVVMAARGIKEKGWEEAILAVLDLHKKYPGLVELNLVGEGAHLEYLKTKYNSPVINFLGYQNDIIEIVNVAHVGILPTYYIAESLPNTIIEYLFCGKPVITTNIGAIKEMILSDQQLAGSCLNLLNGKVQVDFISAAIENYINNPALVERHSAIALQAAGKFTMKCCIENYLKVFDKSSQYNI